MYHVEMTAKADEQLADILFYIADDSGSVDIALKYLNRIESAINRLEDFPYMGRKPKYSILQRQGYRVLIVEKHLVFYKVDDEKKEVRIYQIVNSKREYEKLL